MTQPIPFAQQSLLQQAIDWHRAGRIDQARSVYRQLAATLPDNAHILSLLGSAEGDLGNPEESVRLLTKSLEINPNQPGVYFNRGNALLNLGRFEDAFASYAQATALYPNYAEAYCNQGTALQNLSRLPEALEAYDKALAIRPDLAEAYNNRGSIMHAMERVEEAVASYDKALAIDPRHVGALINRGSAMVVLGHLDEALATYDRILAFRPDAVEAYINRGSVLLTQQKFEAAVASLDRALSLRPELAEPYHNRGIALQALERYEEASASYDKAIALDPDFAWLRGQSLHTRMLLAQWAEFDERLGDIVKAIVNKEKAAVPFVVQALADSPAIERQCAEIFAAHEFPSRQMATSQTPRRDRIRIGYFSSDFGNHPVSHLLAGMLERHDRSRFEVFAFSLSPSNDAWEARIRNAVDRFVDVSNLPDQAIALQARALGIDIAVNLNGHTRSGRTGVFAARAAPVQASYLGYLGTMGAGYIDYLLADDVIVPEASQPFYAEKIVYLPSYQVNDDRQQASAKPVSRRDFGLPESGFVFCSFNQTYKLTPDVFSGWMRILAQVPGSVLWLHAKNPATMRNLRTEARARGIDGDRLVFAGTVPLEDHLARQAAADLFLDTHPYNAGATASNALRMGLPVLTRVGNSFAARMGASLLTAAGLPELITQTPEAYEQLAVALATDPARMAAVKAKLTANLPTCRLFDTAAATRAIEEAFLTMYERNQNGLPVDHIRVAAV